MNAYSFVVHTHSYTRWLVLALAALVCVLTARGWRSGAEWTRVHERAHVALVGVVDAQFTLGVLLYLWLSPYVRAFYAAPGAAMRDATLRFFGIEHVLSMVVAVSILHAARVRSKKLAVGRLRHRRVLLSTLTALLLILIAIPWPFLRYGRPLLRALM